ncbi:MAG: sel1 repeat family protein [Burkholderiales bacterium]|nr:sel1 repeat family protein [Burkholderiales bacterium]
MTRFRFSFVSFALLLFSLGTAYADAKLTPEMQDVLSKAQAGDVQAQVRIAGAYRSGKGAPRDPNEALKWYRSAAEQGDAESQTIIATSYLSERKFEEAFPWYEKAAAQNQPFATHTLAYLYETGSGVEKDSKKALDLYAKAAELGSPEAMFKLGVMYGEGNVTERDTQLSCVWYFRANKYVGEQNHVLLTILGREIARMNRTMEKESLEKCKAQAEDWSPTKVASKTEK